MKKIATFALALLAFSAVAAFAAGPGPFFAKGDYYAGTVGTWNGDAGNQLTEAGGVWSGAVTSDQAAGQHWFKVANDSWSESYGWLSGGGSPQNVQIFTSGPGDIVQISLDTNVYSDGYLPSTNIVWSDRCIQPGWTFEIMGGAPETGGWSTPLATSLVGAVWTQTVSIATPATYEYKFRVSGTWGGLNMGAGGGDAGGANATYTTTTPNEQIKFEFNTATGRVRALPVQATPTRSKTFGGLKAEYR